MGDVKGSATIPGLFVYEFELPQELCGRLIGRQGKHVKSIKERTNANVFIKRHPFDVNLKTVVVEGISFVLLTCLFCMILFVESWFLTGLLIFKFYLKCLFIHKAFNFPFLLLNILVKKVAVVIFFTLKSYQFFLFH